MYHSEPSDVPYSPNQFLDWDFFCQFLQQDGSSSRSRNNINFFFDIETLVFSRIFPYFVPLLRVSFGIFALISHFIFSKSGLYEYDELSPIPTYGLIKCEFIINTSFWNRTNCIKHHYKLPYTRHYNLLLIWNRSWL